MAKNIFNTVQLEKVQSNVFDLSHDIKLSFTMGKLIPTFAAECLPGDKFKISPETLLRFAPLVSPVMHRVRVHTHFFFVPNRILWNNWERWITNDLSSDDYPHPHILYGDILAQMPEKGSLADYFGLPVLGVGEATDYAQPINPFPFAAYFKIYDEYYKDQNLVTIQPELYTLEDGLQSTPFLTSAVMRKNGVRIRAWGHDYFTSALPFAQKGTSIDLPLTQQDDIAVQAREWQGVPFALPHFRYFDNTFQADAGTLATTNTPSIQVDTDPGMNLLYDPSSTLYVDVQASAVDINTLRRAFRLQEWLEKNARGGTRYVESMMVHFGVRSSDARLQRPEYIGGIKSNMVISEVLSTAQTIDQDSNDIPVGMMAGHGISVAGGNTFTHYCEEHGWILGITSVIPETAYQQGIHRSFTRFDQLDYAWPTFANIGEQPILQRELYVANADDRATLEGVFGYIPRYSEYRYLPSRVAGDMRDNLDFWHLGRKFAAPPALNQDFIDCLPDTRIFAVTDPDVDHIYAHVVNNVSVLRKLPRFGVPTI